MGKKESQEEKYQDESRIVQLASELNSETDRGLAIVTSAHLEFLLGQLISSKLEIPPEAEKFLFTGPNPPLGDFHTKIELVRTYQMLSENQIRDLNLIRKIRNDFAHKLIGLSFETPNIKDRCAELVSSKIGGEPNTARERFTKTGIRLIIDITIKVKSKGRI